MLSFSQKRLLFDQLLRTLSLEYETLLAAQKATVEGATHEEARPENDKDTRALEQSYLARGQAARVVTLKNDLDILAQMTLREFNEKSKISFGAFVEAEDEEGRLQLYFVAPSGAGEVLQCSLGAAKVVTGHSPLGRALLGARLGDEVEIESPTGKRTIALIDVS